MNVYIKLEVKNRELEGRLLLAMAAAERGHRVLLGTQSSTVNRVLDGSLKPGVVHEKSIPPAKRRLEQLRGCVERGCVCTSQDEESGLLDEDYKPFAARRFSEGTLELASRAFAWGEHDRDGITQVFPTMAKKVVSTGNPRVDLWRQDFSAYFPPHAGGLAGYILIPSNFLSVLHQKPLWQRVEAERQLGHYEEGRLDEFARYERDAYRTRLLARFVEAIRRLAAAFPDRQVVVRPHPQEQEEAWRGYLGGIENLHVVKQGGISTWIRSAAVVVHNSCTSALEAAACGKPMIAYRPIRSEMDKEIPNRVSVEVETLDGLVDLVGHSLRGEELQTAGDRQSAQALLGRRFINLEGRLAADRIVDEWERLDNGGLSESNEGFQNGGTLVLGQLSGRLKSGARNVLRWGGPSAMAKNAKFPPLTAPELSYLADGFRRTLGRFDDVTARVLEPRLAVIEKRGVIGE